MLRLLGGVNKAGTVVTVLCCDPLAIALSAAASAPT
jgi:hypothetical protein